MSSSINRKRREEEERKARERAERAKRERKCPECDKKVNICLHKETLSLNFLDLSFGVVRLI
jgi:hypothetical protein